MKFRPCIDLHNGQVKQIVGSTLKDDDATTATPSSPTTNFATDTPAATFAERYQADGLDGGHVILLNARDERTTAAARSALAAYPGGLQVGGGIADTATAQAWLEAGASHVIVTSYLFDTSTQDLRWDRLEALRDTVGKEKIVVDLSCRKRPKSLDCAGNTDDLYYVVTNRWQTFTTTAVTPTTLEKLAAYCDEFLVHGVDVEGKQCGILDDLVLLLGKHSPLPVTYAGGVRSIEDLERVERLGQGRVDCTVGSALDIFGGNLSYERVVEWHSKRNTATR